MLIIIIRNINTYNILYNSLAQALLATRPEIERSRARREVHNPETDSTARTHDSFLFKTLM